MEQPLGHVIVITVYNATGTRGIRLKIRIASIVIKINELDMIIKSLIFQSPHIAGASKLSG